MTKVTVTPIRNVNVRVNQSPSSLVSGTSTFSGSANTQSFASINAAGTLVTADGVNSNFILEAGDNVGITANNETKVITITADNYATDNLARQISQNAYDKANTAYDLANTTHVITYTTTSTDEVYVDSFATDTYRSAKYLSQMVSGSDYHTIELTIIHDDVDVYLSQYGEIITNNYPGLGIFDATIDSGILYLSFTPTYADTTIKLVRTLIPI